MPAIEVDDLWQTAVLWAFTGTYDAYGMPKVSAADELTASEGNGVRWEHAKTEATDPQGNTVAIDAIVVVAREVAVHSVMWLGTLASWLSSGSSGDDSELMEVVTYNETPDINNRWIRRTLGLRRFKDQLPTLV